MTCIAAIVDEEGTGFIACDSVGSNRSTKNVYRAPKIFRRGDFLIGFTNSYRMGQLLQYALSVPDRKVAQGLDQYMHVDFVAAVRTAFTDGGFGTADTGGEFLVVTEGRIFTMQSDFSLLEAIDPFEACGSGEDYARATIRTLVNHLDTPDCEDVLTEAIETAANYVPSVGGTVHHLRMPEATKKKKKASS